MNNKKLLVKLSVFGIALAIYYLLIFMLTKTYYVSFWVGFGFITAAFLMTLISSIISGASKHAGKVTGLPLSVQSYMYLVVEFILGNCLMWFDVGFKWSFIPQVILFLLALMLYIPSLVHYLSIEKHNNIAPKQ